MQVEKAINPLLPSGPKAAITSNSGRSTTTRSKDTLNNQLSYTITCIDAENLSTKVVNNNWNCSSVISINDLQ